MPGCVPVPNNARGAGVNNRRGSNIAFRRVQTPRAFPEVATPPANNDRGACPGVVPFVPWAGFDLVPGSQINIWAATQNYGAGGACFLVMYGTTYDGSAPIVPALPIYDGTNVNFVIYYNPNNGFSSGSIHPTNPANPLGVAPLRSFYGYTPGPYQVSFVWPTIGGRPVRWLTVKCDFTDEFSGGPWAYFRRTRGWPAEADYNQNPTSANPPPAGTSTVFRFRPFWGDESGCADSPW